MRFPPMRMGEDPLPSVPALPSSFQIGRSGKLVTACFNHNLREWRWHAPALTPLPSRPGAVPCLTPRNPFSAAGPQEWLYGTPLGCARSNVRFLDELAELPAPSSRIRQHYGIGRGGQLGLQGLQVWMSVEKVVASLGGEGEGACSCCYAGLGQGGVEATSRGEQLSTAMHALMHVSYKVLTVSPHAVPRRCLSAARPAHGLSRCTPAAASAWRCPHSSRSSGSSTRRYGAAYCLRQVSSAAQEQQQLWRDRLLLSLLLLPSLNGHPPACPG